MSGNSDTPADASRMSETDARFLRKKMKDLKKAKQDGREGEAERIAVEILQYFNMDGDSETPILEVVNDVGFAHKIDTRDT